MKKKFLKFVIFYKILYDFIFINLTYTIKIDKLNLKLITKIFYRY